MSQETIRSLQSEINEIKKAGLYKSERILCSPQQAAILVEDSRSVLNLCSNNYLGLANNPEVIEAAKNGLDKWGFGLSSVRFICGTQKVHKQLEHSLSEFLGMDDTILYSSCYDANGGLFETLLGSEDAVISDQLNHASIIDGIRLSKAKRYRYSNNNMQELEEKLKEARGSRRILIATDGVFSMDGTIANLAAICDLADQYSALVMVDDSHAVGFVGEEGRGTPELCGVMKRVDIITGTLGKAMGGASGGYTAARGPIVEWLRQRSRPYLFSNTLSPSIAAASIKVLEMIQKAPQLRRKLKENTAYFREKMTELGFTLAGAGHPIIPVMLGSAQLASDFATRMLEEGIYVIAFSYPVVPKEEARIRTQISAAHSKENLDQAIEAFAKVGRELGVLTKDHHESN